MDDNQGNARTLTEAIRRGLTQGPLSEVDQRIYIHVRDFLAQKFGPKVLTSSPEFLELFNEIVKTDDADLKK